MTQVMNALAILIYYLFQLHSQSLFRIVTLCTSCRFLPHWDEQINMRHPKGRHNPPDDIGANFYPKLGPYSSSDREIIDAHMYDIRKARIGNILLQFLTLFEAACHLCFYSPQELFNRAYRQHSHHAHCE